MSAALVGLHGFSDSAQCLAPFFTSLGVEPVAQPHLLAHGGRTMPPDIGFTHAALVADVRPVVEQAVASVGRPVVLYGHSLGASTAAGVAASAPDLVAALVLEDPPWQPPTSPDGTGPDDRAAERSNPHRDWLAGLQGTDHAGRLAWIDEHNPTWPADERDPWARAKASVDLTLFDAEQHWLRRTWATVARDVRCPTLLLVGEPSREAACEPQVARELAAYPGWQVHEVAGAGHSVRRDQRTRAGELVRQVLDS
jgi:pimeloyl-ACP methyl ester carboxylesterase